MSFQLMYLTIRSVTLSPWAWPKPPARMKPLRRIQRAIWTWLQCAEAFQFKCLRSCYSVCRFVARDSQRRYPLDLRNVEHLL
ncbi:hypothetical protein EV356DRAFT_507672 [Viridothelium virens]|uniref:Uncharacterized protein n=1 Tax=Viridothelium virens TaxID=1048519 RepID=A0A6A6H010_VIRVR|nr:hypothetical protein EV356DRAFT_507672 [Viridothelium virens]